MRQTKPKSAPTIRNDDELVLLIEIIDAASQRREISGKSKSTVDRWISQLRSTARKSGVEAGLPTASGSKTFAFNEPANVFTLDGHPHVSESEATTIRHIFDHWRDVMAKPRARLDDKRSNLIRRRLRENFSQTELQAAIDGCRASPWHQGDNESGTRYVELSLIFRSAEHIERFGEFATSPPKPRSSVGKTEAARAAWVKVMDHVRGGRYRHGGIDEGPIDRAIQAIGGYYAIGQSRSTDLRFIERRFIESFSSSGVDQVPVRRRQQ